MIRVYTKPRCQPCKATKTLMDKLGIEYEAIDITKDEQARTFVTETLDVKEVPLVILSDGQFWTGFKDDKIKELVT